MAQPEVNQTRQSGPQAKKAAHEGTLHDLKPGGPIMPSKQGYVNPGPTPNLRGVEPNTAMHRGTPNPHQSGSHGPIGDYVHDPGKGQADDPHGHGIISFTGTHPGSKEATKATKSPPRPPDPRGVRK